MVQLARWMRSRSGMHRAQRHLGIVFAAVMPLACDVSLPAMARAVQGSGIEKTERRQVPPFEALASEGDFDVRIEVGPAQSVTVTGDDNLLPLVRTEVRDGTLHVESVRSFHSDKSVRVAVTIPRLRAVSISGSGDAEARGFREDAFRAAVSGSGNLLASGEARDLELMVSGSGNVALSGSADRVSAGVSGSGKLDLQGVRARTVRVAVSGSGDALVYASEELDASVSGSGDVGYLGTPRVTQHVSGSGSVQPIAPPRS